jgi:hypothetical protein
VVIAILAKIRCPPIPAINELNCIETVDAQLSEHRITNRVAAWQRQAKV